jgi:hypothetical protein
MLSSPFWAHTDLGGKPWENREDAKRLAERMNHVEAVRLCDPNHDVRRLSVRRRFPRELARPSLLGFHRSPHITGLLHHREIAKRNAA